MTRKLLRLAYVIEFLIALVAIFTAWSEIGGQAALDLMHWGWKLGLSVSLAASVVAYTSALVTEPAVWSLRSIRWLVMTLLIVGAMAGVTYYYFLQEDNGDSGEGDSVSPAALMQSSLRVRL